MRTWARIIHIDSDFYEYLNSVYGDDITISEVLEGLSHFYKETLDDMSPQWTNVLSIKVEKYTERFIINFEDKS